MGFREDQYYIEQVLGGNVSAYRQLVEKHQDLVYTIVKRIVNIEVEAEEVAQDVFVKAYQKLGSFQGESKFSTWLYRIAYNSAVSQTRKKKVEFVAADEQMIENLTEENMQSSILGLNTDEQRKLISNALAVLPRTDNLIISLFYFHGKDTVEIAEIIGMSTSNVKVKLHRIRKRLLKEMNEIIGRNINTVA